MNVVLQVLYIALYCGFILLLARLVADFVRQFAREWEPRRPTIVVLECIYSATDPPLKWLRRHIPPVRILGGAALDLSFLLLIIVVLILISVVAAL